MAGTFTSAATTIPDAFRSLVARLSERCVLKADGTQLTFTELDQLSNRVAHGLLNEQSDRPIAIVAPLAPSSVILFLGALKAGRIFTPIDPRDPPDRVQEILNQLGARLIESVEEISADRDDDPRVELSPQQPSIIYFTSGSAGLPRGIVRTHAQLSYPALGHGIEETDRVGLILPLAFSGSIATIFSPLAIGATGCFFDPITRGVDAIAEWIVAESITLFQTAPTALAAIARPLDTAGRTAPSVRIAIIGGEPCNSDQLTVPRRVFPRATIVNHYGATEAGFLASTRIVPDETVLPGPVPLRAIYPNQIITIVDEDGHPVPSGEPGEMHVAKSRNVMVGFWGPPQEGDRLPTDDGDGSGLRSIQLRDRARLHADGTLELIGRSDLRVKMHGQTVDLQAVERALESLEHVREAVVSAAPDAHGHPRLFAHLAVTRFINSRAIRLALSETLPPYAIPFRFATVEALPRNARGKIDRAALREMVATMPMATFDYLAPRNAREDAIAKMAADALGLPRVGIRDDLFDLGIDSFVWASLLAALNDRLGTDLALSDMLDSPNVEGLARRTEEGQNTDDDVVVPTYSGGEGTPLFCVPGGGGGGTIAMRLLGRRLDRPTYSFVSRGMRRRALPDRTLAAMATRFVAGLRATQPNGPYLLAGYSFGGMLAFEMARQLEAGGQQVGLLVLIDPGTRARSHVTKSGQQLEDEQAGRVTIPVRGPLLHRILRRIKNLIVDRYRLVTAGVVTRNPLQQSVAFFRLHAQMLRLYEPQPYAGRTLLLRTREWKQYDDWNLAQYLTGPTRVETIPGAHMTTFAETNLPALAASIREELAAVEFRSILDKVGA